MVLYESINNQYNIKYQNIISEHISTYPYRKNNTLVFIFHFTEKWFKGTIERRE